MSKPKASIFEMDGVPEFGQALPLALQHVVAKRIWILPTG